MKRKVTAIFLTAAMLLTGTGMTDFVQAATKEKAWYEDVEFDIPELEDAADGDYVPSVNGENVPVANENLASGLKGASGIPSAYMNTLAQLTAAYPSTRSQGNYETCWAFSAVGLAEFDLITDNKTADKSIDLSELQLSYFTYHNEEDKFGGTLGDSFTTSYGYLQTGGNLAYCTRTLLQWQGVIEESDLPYAQAASIKTLSNSYAFDKDVAHLQNAYIININKNPDLVKKEIMNHGSAGVGIYMADTTIFDGAGYYDAAGGTVSTYYCPYSGDEYTPNHAVNIVGWDDDFPASNFAYTPAGNGAWLIRNSWSDTAKNNIDSYFWLSYYDAALEDDAWIYDFESADNYDYIYQYDGCAYVYKAAPFPTSANVFKVQGASNEQLEAVSITLNEDADVPYTIKVYTNLTNAAKPRSGILAAKVTGRTTYAGTYTIPLNKAVSLPKGTYYSIVVELGKKSAGIDMEISAKGGGLQSTAFADFNQSLVYYGGVWEDLADVGDYLGIGNLCIKGFTSKTGASVSKTQNLKSSSIKKTSAKLSWTKVSGATGYEVYRATSKNGTYTKVATVKTRSYTNKKLKSGKTYYYKVRAYKKKGNTTVYGALSKAVTVKTKKK